MVCASHHPQEGSGNGLSRICLSVTNTDCVLSLFLFLMEAPGVRRRAPPEALAAYFSSLGETEAHVLAEQARVRDAYLQMEWRELPEARQDRLLSAPFLHSLTAARAYDEADWGAAVVRCEPEFNAQKNDGREGERKEEALFASGTLFREERPGKSCGISAGLR